MLCSCCIYSSCIFNIKSTYGSAGPLLMLLKAQRILDYISGNYITTVGYHTHITIITHAIGMHRKRKINRFLCLFLKVFYRTYFFEIVYITTSHFRILRLGTTIFSLIFLTIRIPMQCKHLSYRYYVYKVRILQSNLNIC